MLSWLDRNLWVAPVIAFFAGEITLLCWQGFATNPVLLADLPPTSRQQVYSSLTGSSSALLGFAIAAVAIIAAFAPRDSNSPARRNAEKKLSTARTQLMSALLATSTFLLVILVCSTIALAIDTEKVGYESLTTVIEGATFASLIGLIVGGAGLALAVAERSRT